jgi:hypothetical protein
MCAAVRSDGFGIQIWNRGGIAAAVFFFIGVNKNVVKTLTRKT